ncbi:MAG: hypothetical protein HQL30_11065 [Candidatus Omnitrophica bacterium]|nr:hypothetical protein [Candidatus Omnitrophota bacterium]
MRATIKVAASLFSLFLMCCVRVIPAFPASEIAVVIDCRGDGLIIPSKSDLGVRCEKGLVVNPGDWVKTGPGAAVTLAFDKGFNNLVTVKENSLAVAMPDGYFNMDLLEGSVFGDLGKIKSNRCFRLMSPAVAMETASGAWSARNEGAYTEVSVFRGTAAMTGMNPDGSLKKEKKAVAEGYGIKIMNNSDPGELEPNSEPLTAWAMDEIAKLRATRQTALSEMSENKLKIAEPPKSVFGKNSKVDTKIVYGGQEVNLEEYLSLEKNKVSGKVPSGDHGK